MAATLNANPIIYHTSATPSSSLIGRRGSQRDRSASSYEDEEDDSTDELEGLSAAQLPFLSSAKLVTPSALGHAPASPPAASRADAAATRRTWHSSSSSSLFLPLPSSSSVGGDSSAPSALSTAGAPRDAWDALEVFELVRGIVDPEHPLTLEQLHVTQLHLISVDDDDSHIDVRFTPTINHCSMATLIGLCLRVQLLRTLPQRFKVDIRITEGSHATEAAINKQLNDKERVAAALENDHLLDVVNKCINRAEEGGNE